MAGVHGEGKIKSLKAYWLDRNELSANLGQMSGKQSPMYISVQATSSFRMRGGQDNEKTEASERDIEEEKDDMEAGEGYESFENAEDVLIASGYHNQVNI